MSDLPRQDTLGHRARKRLAWTWVNLWLAWSGYGFFGRIASRLAAAGFPPYKGRLELAQIQPKGFISADAKIHHSDLTVGKNVFVGDRVIIYQHSGGGPVQLGDRVILLDEIIAETFPGGGLHVGDDTAIQPRCHFTAAVEAIHIGKGVQIAPQCAFYSYDHGTAPDQSIRSQPLVSKGPIVIEDDVWLGFGAIVLSGVHIGKGAVIGAGAVVTRDVPEGAMAAGAPARIVKMRHEFTEAERTHFQRVDS